MNVHYQDLAYDGSVPGERTYLTARQDKVEDAIVRCLREGATRSDLRSVVEQFVDLLHVHGMGAEEAVVRVEQVARRAEPQMVARPSGIVGESVDDRLVMIARWCRSRWYARAD